MNPFSPGQGNGDNPLVINSDYWKSHFLSGGKKTGAASEPWAGPASAGKEKREPQIGPNPGYGLALTAHPKIAKHQETVGKTS